MSTQPFLFTRRKGFTLIELLVSMAILMLLMLMLISITTATQHTWSYTTGKVEQFRDAREAFESVTRKVGQATLNTYWDYHYAAGATTPDRYIRQSELRFISGNMSAIATTGTFPNIPTQAIFFQAPLGYVNDTTNYANLETLLNTCGYFVEFGSDKSWRPGFVNNLTNGPAERYRFRLMELMEPSEQLTLYTYTSGSDATGNAKTSSYVTSEWFTTPLSLPLPPAAAPNRPARVLAENIIALVLIPKLTPQEDPTGSALAPSYTYNSATTGAATSLTGTAAAAVNSKNQLPPVVQVTMVAVDDPSFSRFVGTTVTSGTSAPSMATSLFTDSGGNALFQTVGDTVNSANPGYAQDMQTLQKNLRAHKINYRVFTSDVSIKAAKWSRLQTN